MNQQKSDGARAFISLVEVERDETDTGAGGWVTFDSFAGQSLDAYIHSRALASFGGTKGLGLLTLRAPYNLVRALLPNIDELNGAWLRIKVNGQANEARIPAQVVMFGDSTDAPQVGIETIELLPTNTDEMASIWMLHADVTNTASVISGLLDIPLLGLNLEKIFVAAYDVGQGNCNAIVDCYEHPRIFFDLGWAPNFHAKSRPPCVPELFSCDSSIGAPVVLSHWDMDHWCYAIQSSAFDPGSLTTTHTWKPEALKRFWIARAPLSNAHKIGPLTRSFYDALASTQLLPGFSAIQLWPEGTKRISFSAGWLEACTPAAGGPSDRNNTGIAMFVRPSTKRGAILLPGDADFPSIPSLAGKRKTPLAGMVAPHHGARVTPGSAPGPLKGSPSRLAMSVGDGNSYGHPKKQAIDEYEKLGWKSSRTQDRYCCPRTGCHPAHHHGNTLLKVHKSISDPKCGCKCVDNGKLCLVPSAHPVASPVAGAKKRKSTKKKTKKPAAATV